MEVVRQANEGSEYQSHRHQLPCPTPRGLHPHPFFPPWRCCRLHKMQGPAWLSWHPVNLETCHPTMPAKPPRKPIAHLR